MTTPGLGRVLIVDDELELMTALCDMLTLQGYEAVGHTSPQEALQALRGQNFDVLLSDLMMPEMDGITLLQTALALDPYLMGIVMTGQGTVQTAVAAMRVGAFDYLLKPFQFEALASVLTRAQKMRQLCMENVQLRETMAIYELGQTMGHTFDMPTLLHQVATGAMQQVGADETSVMLPAPDGEALYIAAVQGEGREALLGKRVPMEQSMAGWVMHHAEPLTLHDAVSDPRFAALQLRHDMSTLALPMQAGGRCVGVLNVNATHRSSFTSGQVKALSIFANLAAAALESAALYTEVRQAEAQYRGIFENAPHGIFQATPDERLSTVNPALVRLMGYASPAEMLASVNNITQHMNVEPHSYAEFKRLLREHRAVAGFEVRLSRKDGSTIWMSTSARAICDAHGTVLRYEGIVEDITARKQAEEVLQQQHETLYQSEKLATMGQLLAGVAHELNNPLSIVLGHAALLQEQLANTPLATRGQKITQAAERCARIVKNFLALARQRPPEQHVVRLNQIVVETVELLAYQLRVDNVEVCLHLAEALPTLWADPHQLSQLLVNLISNAHQAMHDTPLPRRLTLTTQADPELAHVRLEVADTGPGIPPALHRQIFEPFFTTKPPGVGTGLGLSLCYSIVATHRGIIRAENRPGQGAVFVVDLPVTMAPKVTAAAPFPDAPLLPKAAILVVDDEPLIAEVLVEMLSADGHHVESAANGVMALEKLRERAYDLIVSDLRMPELDGPGLYRELQNRHPGFCQRIIFLTGDTLNLETQGFLEQTAAPTLNKPFVWEEVRRIVQQALHPCKESSK